MKIAHVLNELRHSGAEVLLSSASSYMLEAGEVTIISTGQSEGDYASELRSVGYHVVHVPFSKSISFLYKVSKIFYEGGFDVIHVHPERGAVWYSILAAFRGIPVVRTIHNEFVFNASLRFRRAVSRRIAALLGTRHVSCSPSVQRSEFREFGLKTLMINNWFDPNRVSLLSNEDRTLLRRKLEIPTQVFLAVSIANEAPAKNLRTLFLAIKQLEESENNVWLYHCGTVSDALRKEFTNIKSLKMLGTVDGIGEYLAASDAFVSSSFNEGGQIVLLEAGASGTFCITTKVGLAELLEESPAIRFAEPNVGSLVEAIKDVLKISPDQRRSDALLLSQTVRKDFVPEVGARRYLELYRSLVDRGVAS